MSTQNVKNKGVAKPERPKDSEKKPVAWCGTQNLTNKGVATPDWPKAGIGEDLSVRPGSGETELTANLLKKRKRNGKNKYAIRTEERWKRGKNEEEDRGQNACKVTDKGGTIFDKENWKNLQEKADLHRTKKNSLKKKPKIRSKLLKEGKNVQEIINFFEAATKTKKKEIKIEKYAEFGKLGVTGGRKLKQSLLPAQPRKLSSLNNSEGPYTKDCGTSSVIK